MKKKQEPIYKDSGTNLQIKDTGVSREEFSYECFNCLGAKGNEIRLEEVVGEPPNLTHFCSLIP